MKRIIAILALLTLAACGGGGGGGGGSSTPSTTYTAKSGVAQKGPLIKGSTVTAQELSSTLAPSGQQYSYQTTSDFGAFSPTNSFASQYIGTNASGYYFDELANAISTGPVTLNGYSDLATDTVLNVNLLTTLEYQRIQNLVTKSNMTFAAARAQAEKEVLTALNIPAGSYGPFSTLDISGGTDGDHILAAISSIFIYGNSAGPLSELIANFQSDIGANGVITNAKTTAALVAASESINPAIVAANLTTFYAADGVVYAASDISDWISHFGDGVVGKFAFYVEDATASSTFTFPTFVVNVIAGTSISITAGQLTVNGKAVTGAVTVQASDVIAVSPGAGAFPNGDLTVYLLSGQTKTARVSFVSGLVSLAITPSTPSLPLGLTQQFTATGTFTDNSTANLTSKVSWTSGTLPIATINLYSGLANTLAVGTTVITASSGSVSASTTLTVTPVALESISIAPKPVTAGVGIVQQLFAAGTYSDGSTQTITTAANWTSDAVSVATIGPTTGLLTGVSTGSGTISATIGSIVGTAPLSVIANAWFPTGSMQTPRYNHTATLLTNGTVLVAGGSTYSQIGGWYPGPSSASSEIYDSTTGTWSNAGSMTTPRAGHTATLLPNGTVLVAGGFSNAGAEIYDPVADTWTATGSMSIARAWHTATLLSNGTVLVAGGLGDVNNNYSGSITATAEIYDPAAGTWTLTSSMSTARYIHKATLLPNGTVLVAGGSPVTPDGEGNGGAAVTSAEIYDSVAGTWTLTGSMIAARSNYTATLLPNGTVLVAGGGASLSGGPIASAEVFDPSAGTWTLTGNMTTARWQHTATLLPNGTVLVAGGDGECCNGAALSSAEVYNPTAGAWTVTGSMALPRAWQTATLQSNGTVLVAGGTPIYYEASSLASAEIYDNLL